LSQSIAFQDEGFSAQKAIHYHVNFYVALNGIVYSVFDTTQKKIVVLKSYENIELNSNDGIFLLLRKIYAEQGYVRLALKVTVITENTTSYIFPLELFDEELSRKSIDEIHQTNHNTHEYFVDSCERFRIKSLNITEKGFLNYLSQFQISQCKTLQFALLDHIPVSQTIPHQLYLFVGYDYLYFYYFSQGNFQFSNHFKHNSNEDVLFYTLFIYNNFDLNPDQIPIVLGGNIDKDGALYQLLFKYIRHIKTWEIEANTAASITMPEIMLKKHIPSIYSF
jgi:hypothetical protein